MKLIVKNTFRDKTDHVTVYEPETILEVKDKERAADLVKRGLCAEYKGKKAAAVTLGEETPEEPESPEKPESPESPDETENPVEAPAEGEKPKSEKQ